MINGNNTKFQLAKDKAIVTYKGFNKIAPNKGKCREHVFELGIEYTVGGDIVTCNNGFHACLKPNDVLKHYHYANGGKIYGKVKQWGRIHEDSDKLASSHIEVEKFMTIGEFQKLCGIDTSKERERAKQLRINEKKRIARDKIAAAKRKIFTNNKLVVNINSWDKTFLVNMKKDAVITTNRIFHVISKERATIIGRFKSINGVKGTKFVFTNGIIVIAGKDGIKSNTRYELVKGKLKQKAA